MFRRLLNLFRPDELEAGIREELEFHRSQTHGEFGNLGVIQDRTRAASTVVPLETILHDIRYGLRQLRKTPVLSTVLVLSLALGIGANTAVFTLINAVMLQSLPVKNPHELVLLYDGVNTGVYSGDDIHGDSLSYPEWEFLRDHNTSFQELSAFRQGSDNLVMRMTGASSSGPKEQARGHLVSGTYFRVLGVEAAAGRVLTPEDDAIAAPPVAVISDSFWRRRFQRKPAAVGSTVDLNGTAFTIVGVAPREFYGERVESPPDFWLPLTRQAEILQRESWMGERDVYWLNLIARLKPGVTLDRAGAIVSTQVRQFYLAHAGEHPSQELLRKIREVQVRLKPGARGISWMRFTYSEPLHILMAVVGLVLLIACANVATLLLSRAHARRHELFARLAVGASRSRLIRQLLTESVLLALLGGAAGVVIAWWGVKALVLIVRVNSVVKVVPDLIVLGFTLMVSILTGLIFGLIPALRSSRMEWRIASAVRAPDVRTSRLNPAYGLVVLQVALSSILLVGAGLLTHTLVDLETQDLGFNRDRLLLVTTDPRLAGYQPDQLPALYRQFDETLNSLPGVESASLARYSPISGSSSSGNFSLEGYTLPAGKRMDAYFVEVGPRFFETLGIPTLLGRTIEPRDGFGGSGVVVVNKTFVDQFLPGQNPLGRHYSKGSPFRAPGMEIVGVVADSKYYKAGETAKPMIFSSAWQADGSHAYAGELLIRTTGDPASSSRAVREAIRRIDGRLPVLKTTTLREQISDSMQHQRAITTFCAVFGLVALSLASIGLYGTMAYAVARRTNEIGIRMALGAQRAHVLWIVLRDSAALVIIGLALGLSLAMVAARWISSLLYGLRPSDPAALAGAITLMAAASILAGYLPARRAARVDPMVALRNE